MTELGQYIQLVDDIIDGDLTRLHSHWRQFDLVVDDKACPARILARIETQDLVEYVIADQNKLIRTGLRWIEHETQRETVADIGEDVDYWSFSNSILDLLSYEQVQWLGFPDGEEHAPRPKVQYDDRACLRVLARSDSRPMEPTRRTVRPHTLSNRGAAAVLAAWSGEPVEVKWKGNHTWSGILETSDPAEEVQSVLLVLALSDYREEAPAVGNRVKFDSTKTSRVFNRSRESVLIPLGGMWDYRPSLGSTAREKPFTRDIFYPLEQEEIDVLVEQVKAGAEVEISTQEIVERWLAAGNWGDCQLGSSAYWLLHEKENPEKEEDDDFDDEGEGAPLFIYELVHSDGEKVFIAVQTSNWSSFDGGPSWSNYDERIYLSMEAIQGAYGDGCEIEMVG
ncbi:MAG: hypothetical protein VCF24_25155 [Candidatus Latescibacterota bacterium]